MPGNKNRISWRCACLPPSGQSAAWHTSKHDNFSLIAYIFFETLNQCSQILISMYTRTTFFFRNDENIFLRKRLVFLKMWLEIWFNNYLLGACSVPASLLGTEEGAMNKTNGSWHLSLPHPPKNNCDEIKNQKS